MQEEIKVWLEDIEKAIAEINNFLPEPRNFLEFEKDLKTKRAVERNIEILGEAMRRIFQSAIHGKSLIPETVLPMAMTVCLTMLCG